MTTPQSRPRVVAAAFWCLVIAAVLLISGGLLAATAAVPLPAVFRGAGVLTAVAGVALALLTRKVRDGDVRFRRATLALALTIVVLVALCGVFGIVHVVTLVAVLPLIAGVALLSRPAGATPTEDTT